MKLIAILTFVVTLAIGGYTRFASDPPGYDRARLHHWLYADELTELAERLLAVPNFNFVYKNEDTVAISYGRGPQATSALPVGSELQSELLPLFENARVNHLFSGAHDGSAFLELSYLWPYQDRHYSMLLVFRAPERNLCLSASFDAEEGACQVRLDEKWTLEYLWYPRVRPEDAA